MKQADYSIEDIEKKLQEYNKKADIKLLAKAFSLVADLPSEFQNRKKEAHLLNTAHILAESELDEETVIAGLLHHLLRNNAFTKESIEKGFGKEIAELIEGVEKIDAIENKNRKTANPETIGKLILATARDIRVIFIRLAARLEALRAIDFLPEQSQKELAQSTLDIYVPICHKLGLHKIRWELEDLAMKKLDRQAYEKIKAEIKQTREEREKDVEEISKELEATLNKKSIECKVYGRAKNFYRINKKMIEQNKKLSEIYDLLAFRTICNSEKECYEALSALQEQYKQIPSEFRDYIANPKPNKYQSIHLGLFFKGTPIEVQIRTWEMHRTAEDGLAAHWQYKQYKKDKHFDSRLSIAKQLTEWQRSAKDAKELIDSMKLSFEGDKVFVFSPKQELIELDYGSTPVDFAFAVHSALGLKCERAKANGKIVPLDYKLENGDTVEILVSEKQNPKQQWLAFVKTEKAKQKIRQALEIPAAAKPPKKTILQRLLEFSTRQKQAARTAKCCNPLPGDKIIGVRTTKRKIVIHRADCKNISGIPESKKVLVSGQLFEKGSYDVALKIDAENRPGILPEILNALASSNSTVTATNAKLLPNNKISCTVNTKIRGLSELEKILEKIKKIKGVTNAERA